ncbi:MAG: FAD-binding oxidoreductase [Terriglobales bacterium]
MRKPVPAAYLEDESGYTGHGEELFRPETAQQAADVLAAAARSGTPVTVAGAGTGVVGGRVPEGGWVLSTERLRRLEIGTGRAIVGAGILLQDLQIAAKSSGQFYAPDPTEWVASVGGTIATNASGSRSFLYGSTRQHLLSVTVALMDGTVRTYGRGERLDFPYTPLPAPRCRKHAAGYYLRPETGFLELLCGSEGTLAVVLEAEVQLLPQPGRLLSGVVFFRSEDVSLDAVDAWRDVPQLRMLEFFDAPSLGLLRAAYPEIPDQAGAALLVEQIVDPLEEDAEEAWLGRMESAQALDESWFGTTDADRERFRIFRHKLPEVVNERIKRNGFQKMGTDAAVPLDRNREMMRWYRQVLDEEFPGKAVMYGHIGDAHVHVNVMPETEDQARRGRAFQYDSARQAVALGGTVSAEHGLGKKKAHFLALEFTPEQIQAMCDVKRHFDPQWLLGRGNLLPVPE